MKNPKIYNQEENSSAKSPFTQNIRSKIYTYFTYLAVTISKSERKLN